jgi:hypothetical protein
LVVIHACPWVEWAVLWKLVDVRTIQGQNIRFDFLGCGAGRSPVTVPRAWHFAKLGSCVVYVQ